MEGNKEYYTVAEAAELLGMSISYINKLINGKKIASMKEPHKGGQGGFQYLIPQFEVDRMLDARHGAIESAELEKQNKFITIETLAEVSDIAAKIIREDIKAGKLKYDWVPNTHSKGGRKGINVAEAKRYIRAKEKGAPTFLTAEEFMEVLG